MIKTIKERFSEIFRDSDPLPVINELSTLHEVGQIYERTFPFLERKYGIKIEPDDRTLSLKAFSEKFGLPPAQILFVDVQMHHRNKPVKELTPKEAQKMMVTNGQTRLLDVREDWEMEIGTIPNSTPLTPSILDELLTSASKDAPLLLYCHFGVRSLDAATFLLDRGFTQVYLLKGGIEAWSLEIDPSVPRYQGQYC